MKKIFGFLMAVAVLFTTSCAKEDISSSIANGETVEVTFTANLPELGTRATTYGNGNSARTLQFFVYEYQDEDVIGTYLPDVKMYTADNNVGTNIISSETTHFNFSLSLIKGMKYNIVFWADKGDNSPYSVDSTGYVTVNYTGASANDDTRDAFFGVLKNFDPAAADAQQTARDIKLYRPFAQLNAATLDLTDVQNSGIVLSTLTSSVKVENAYTTLNLFNGEVSNPTPATFAATAIPATNSEVLPGKSEYDYLSMNYVLVNTKELVETTFTFYGKRNENDSDENKVKLAENKYTSVPLQRNYRTNILGKLITKSTDFEVEILPGFGGDYDIEDETVTAKVDTAEEFVAAFEDDSNVDVVVLDGDIDLNALFASLASTRAAADPALTIKSGKTFTIDLGGNKLSATSTQTGKNYNMFDVLGTLTVKNGTIEYEHKGENMGWNSSTNIFNVTAGGVLNLEGVTAKNLGGSDMGFVAHLNNWGEVTLNVDNCTLVSNYVPVRVFNSGPDMNNVTIKNSTLNGVSAAFWVHNYTAVDFGGKLYSGSSEAYDKERVAARLKLNIYNQGNTFSPDLNGIRYGFTNSIRTDAYGITKTVSEDGTEVTLGSIIDDGLIRRGVAGAEENTTIKKAIVGEGVTTLYDRTFRRFYALETVELPSTLTTIGAAGSGVFQSCTALKNIVLPESVTVLGKGSFQECSSLESINIPAGVTRIEADCLRATGLKEVEFHAGVTYFGAMAFRDCKQLKKVVINAPVFTMEANCFGSMAAPYPAVTIEVANAEMKAYVESKLTDNAKTYITVVAPTAVTNKESLQAALDNAIKAGETNIKIDATNFTGDLNYGFTNSNVPTGVTVTIRNAKVTARSKWNYLNGTIIFENCEFTAGLYSIHFDDNDGVGDVIFKNCKLVGWLPFAAINSVSFENCHLTGNGSYALIRSYANLSLKNCVIDTTLANHTDEYTDGVQVIDAELTEENVTYIDNHTTYLQNVLKAGKNVVLSSDLTINENEMLTAPYGNKTALSQKGGVFNGNGKNIAVTANGDNYVVMTNGGTIKNLDIDRGFRGIVIMSPNQDVYVDKVNIGVDDEVCYTINTAEGDGTHSLHVSNSVLKGWCSIGTAVKDVTFTNCTFGQGTYYTDVYGRLVKPYVNAIFDGCEFCSMAYIDLSALVDDQVVTLKNCSVNGVKITAENWTSLVAPESTCGEGQISVELKNGSYLTAENVADYIVFE